MAEATFTFKLAAIPVGVEYRNIKTMRLTVYPPDGRVVIAAPNGTAPDAIKKFAASRIPWIEKHRERFLHHSKITVTLANHSNVFIWGEAHELALIEHQGNHKITVKDGYIKMYIRPGSSKAKKQELLDKWYRRVLKETAPDIISKWEEIMGVEVKKLYVRKMKSHWGSCNQKNRTIRLNSELVKRNPACLEYVIIHEMLHIIEKSHNRNFYRLLEKYLPEWKDIRKKMNSGDL